MLYQTTSERGKSSQIDFLEYVVRFKNGFSSKAWIKVRRRKYMSWLAALKE